MSEESDLKIAQTLTTIQDQIQTDTRHISLDNNADTWDFAQNQEANAQQVPDECDKLSLSLCSLRKSLLYNIYPSLASCLNFAIDSDDRPFLPLNQVPFFNQSQSDN